MHMHLILRKDMSRSRVHIVRQIRSGKKIILASESKVNVKVKVGVTLL